VDEDVCIGCGVCEDDRCPIREVRIIEDIAQVNPNLCIGCGLCVTTCEAEAISIVPCEHASDTLASVSEMGLRVVQRMAGSMIL